MSFQGMPWRIGCTVLAIAAFLSGCDRVEPVSQQDSQPQDAQRDDSLGGAARSSPDSLATAGREADVGNSDPTNLLPGDDGTGTRDLNRAGDTASASNHQGTPAVSSLMDGGNSTSVPAESGASQNNRSLTDKTDILNRPFATIRPIDSEAPDALMAHLKSIDQAIGDLVLAGSNNIVEKEMFVDFGMRLGKMKLETGQTLSNSPEATKEQRKAGVLATIIALSHMSGLGDVASAKQLESIARGLINSEDPDLAHQSRVVLVGFELQALQNGLKSDADALLSQVEGLFVRPEDRNFPEFMMAQQAIHVLTQMGFAEEAKQVRRILVDAYQDSSDPQLRNQTWAFATRDSQALQNYNQATRALGSSNFRPQDLFAAARGLFQAFPNAQTLEQLARSIANIEYSGFVELSGQLAQWIKEEMHAFDSSAASSAAAKLIADHEARLSLIGKPLELDNLVDFNGRPIDWSEYENQVVLVDFWATWCVPCLQELPNIREIYAQMESEGFAVVGVNMDEEVETAKNFILKQDFPWKNYRFADAAGFQSEFARQSGLNMIPFLVLVGRDGEVLQIHVRGKKLATAVRSAMGLETSLIP